jgi:WD40 repeat protein
MSILVRTIATGSSDATIKLWNREGQLLTTLEGHIDRVMSVSFSPDGQLLASTSVDNSVKLWNLKDLRLTSNLDTLVGQGCTWIDDYLRTNEKVEERDRQLCNGLISESEK